MRTTAKLFFLLISALAIASCVTQSNSSIISTKWSLENEYLLGHVEDRPIFSIGCGNFILVSISKSKIRGFSVSSGIFLIQHDGQEIIRHKVRVYDQGAFIGTGSRSPQEDEQIRQLVRIISKNEGSLFVSVIEESGNADLSFEGTYGLKGAGPLVRRLIDKCPLPKRKIGI